MAGKKYKTAAEKNTVNAFTEQRFDEFYKQPENSIDMVFIGSSHSYCTFDPEIIERVPRHKQLADGHPVPACGYVVLRFKGNF